MSVRIVCVLMAVFTFLLCSSESFASAKQMTAEERRQQILEQQAKEQQTKQQRAQDQSAAQETVNEQIALEQSSVEAPTYLRATTSEDTTGISAKKLAKGYRYVNLRWKVSANAESYTVYYSYEKNGTYKAKGQAVTTNTKRMLFKNNKEVFLRVVAHNGANTSKRSEYVVIFPGYGSLVNAMKIKFTDCSEVMFSGFTKVFKLNTSASMLKTYKIKWSSSDKNVATVSKSGKVTAKNAGTVQITARSHTGFKATTTVTVKVTTPTGVPDVTGASAKDAKQLLKNAGFKAKVKTKYIKKKTLNKKYPGVPMGTVFKQSQDPGSKIQKGSTVTVTVSDEIYDCGVGVEAMVKWAEKVAADDSYGYSMGVYTGRGLDRLCPYTNSGASKDYDCATFVNAALAYSGMGDEFMKATHKPSPVVGGVKAIMIRNGWKKVLVKGKKPTVKQLKRGDIVLDVRRHIQIHAGNGMDVGAHNNYDGKSGDSSGREVSVNYSWTGYAEVYRYYGNIGKKK